VKRRAWPVAAKKREMRRNVKKLKEEEYWKNPDISKDTLEFVLSLSVERKIQKISELETVHATKEQQEEMEALLKKDKK
jgi:hypothetical protein